MKRGMLPLASLLILGCSSQESAPPVADAAPADPAQESGVLLRMDFDVKLVYGDFQAESEEGLWTFSVSEDGSAKLMLAPNGGGDPKEMFNASTEPTFDGLRLVVNRVKGKRKEAEAYVKALEDGYELKNKRLMDDLDFPKTFKVNG